MKASSISGSDTICYNTIPNELSQAVLPSGGDGVFTYQWQEKNSTGWNDIDGATTTSFQLSELTQTTTYRLKITNECGVVYSNEQTIHVRPELTAPTIQDNQETICYNTQPSALSISIHAKGGNDDTFTYQWQESKEGTSFTDILGAIGSTYQPSSLKSDCYYRVIATSDKGCGSIVSSNNVKISVYEPLSISTEGTEPLCYMSQGTIKVIASGAGDDFTYQWQESTDNISFHNCTINATNAEYTTTPKSAGMYYYRCVVTPTLGCSIETSETISVEVYEDLLPGIISGSDTICYNTIPNTLSQTILPSGGDGVFTYQWQEKNSKGWNDIDGATTNNYTPSALTNTTIYRLKVSNNCSIEYTNEVEIFVNPLPEVQNIFGAKEVCYNQYETYSIDKLFEGFSYQWYVDNSHGTLTTEAENATSVEILWNHANEQDSVCLLVKNNKTGCEREIKFGVKICNEQAPERTIIVRKPNSNILLCKEDNDIYYQWGYTDKTTQEEILIDDSNRRYVLLPFAFDKITYDYWLVLRNDVNSKCYSKSYYSPENDALISQKARVVTVPSFIRGNVPIIVHNSESEQVISEIFTITGLLYNRQELGNDSYIETTLPFNLTSGVYIMRVKIGDNVETIKLIAE